MAYSFKCDLIGLRVYLVIGDKKQLKRFKCYEETYFDAETHEVEVEEVDTGIKQKWFLVWINRTNDYHGMVHETMHLVKRIFNVVGIPFNSDNEEIIAYYQNYWVRKFWHKMSKEVKNG